MNTQIFHLNKYDLKGNKSEWFVDAFLSKLCGSLTLYLVLLLYLPLFLYAIINLHTAKCFQICSISICHSLLRKVILGIRLFDDIFFSGCCLRFISPYGGFYKELKEKSSLSLYLLPFTLSFILICLVS